MLSLKNRINIQKKYEVIGIYIAPEFSDGYHSFNANTIFIPKASIPDAWKYEEWTKPFLYSVVLKNGSEEFFENAAKKKELENYFIYNNQGYDAVKGSVTTIRKNARRLSIASMTGVVLALASVVFILTKRLSVIVTKMRLLGARKTMIWCQSMSMLVIVFGISAVLGLILGVSLCDTVVNYVFKRAIPIKPLTIIISAAVEYVLFLLCALVMMLGMLRRNLMSR